MWGDYAVAAYRRMYLSTPRPAAAAAAAPPRPPRRRLQYAAHGSTAVIPDIAAFHAAVSTLPFTGMLVPASPHPRLGVRVPAAAVNPVIREVTQGYALAGCASELPPNALQPPPPPQQQAAAAAHAAALAALARLLPGGPSAAPLATPRRFYELPLRPDVSDAQVRWQCRHCRRLQGRDVPPPLPHPDASGSGGHCRSGARSGARRSALHSALGAPPATGCRARARLLVLPCSHAGELGAGAVCGGDEGIA